MIDKSLTIEIVNNELVISIGVATLAYAVQSDDRWPIDFYVLDIAEFAKDVARELDSDLSYGMSGDTLITRALDTAARATLENGSMACEEGDAEKGIEIAKSYFKD